MPDPTPNPQPDTNQAATQSTTASPQSDTKKKAARSRGLINKAHEDTVSKTEKLIATAKKAAYAPTLAEREIDDAFLTALAGKCDTARSLIGQAVDKVSDKAGATKAEAAAKATLVGLAREVQRAAKQKYATDKPEQLKDYGVGSNIDQNRAALEQAVAGMLDKLKTDTLPGITPAKVTALAAALQAYKATDVAQAGARTDAAGKRRALDELMADINKDRRKILYAVEAAWPSDNKANGAIRTEFGLSPTRPYNG